MMIVRGVRKSGKMAIFREKDLKIIPWPLRGVPNNEELALVLGLSVVPFHRGVVSDVKALPGSGLPTVVVRILPDVYAAEIERLEAEIKAHSDAIVATKKLIQDTIEKALPIANRVRLSDVRNALSTSEVAK